MHDRAIFQNQCRADEHERQLEREIAMQDRATFHTEQQVDAYERQLERELAQTDSEDTD